VTPKEGGRKETQGVTWYNGFQRGERKKRIPSFYVTQGGDTAYFCARRKEKRKKSGNSLLARKNRMLRPAALLREKGGGNSRHHTEEKWGLAVVKTGGKLFSIRERKKSLTSSGRERKSQTVDEEKKGGRRCEGGSVRGAVTRPQLTKKRKKNEIDAVSDLAVLRKGRGEGVEVYNSPYRYQKKKGWSRLSPPNLVAEKEKKKGKKERERIGIVASVGRVGGGSGVRDDKN